MTAAQPVLIATLEDVYRAVPSLRDGEDDLWLGDALSAVARALERVAGTFLAPRPATTWYTEGSGSRTLTVPQGIASLAYLGLGPWYDQPDDGTGAYTAQPSFWLDPSAWEREAWESATSVTLPIGILFPPFRRAVKLTGVQGPAQPNPRDVAIARTAVVRAYRAKSSGAADYAVVGPDGGMRILRDFAPSELAELRGAYRVGAD